MTELFGTIKEELAMVEEKLENELNIKKAGNAGDFVNLDFLQIDYIIRPAIVIISSKLFNFQKEKSILLASIMQLIYMASQVHGSIKETEVIEKNAQVKDGCQFPVLVGDYLYGKFFNLLSYNELLNYLEKIAEIICEINEGDILRQLQNESNFKKAPELMEKVVQKEVAEIFAGFSSIAAEVSGAKNIEVEQMYQFGHHFGMGYGLLKWGVANEKVKIHFNIATDILAKFATRKLWQDWEQFLNILSKEEFAFKRMVV